MTEFQRVLRHEKKMAKKGFFRFYKNEGVFSIIGSYRCRRTQPKRSRMIGEVI